MFVGRYMEMAELQRRYDQNGFQFPVIYGRRRIGKTRLIQEFLKNKRAIYFMATEQTPDILLHQVSEAVLSVVPSSFLSSFASWDDLFRYLADASKKERLVFVIDEYPYLAEVYPPISSILQKNIDISLKETQLYLVLCGSSMSFMEKQVLGVQSPLHGRRTAGLCLQPLPYYQAIQFFPGWSDEEKLYAYGICGGVPRYLEIFASYPTLKHAVIGEFLSLSGHLLEEPATLLKQELREPETYNSILSFVAGGANKLSVIASKLGKTSSDITLYMQNLLSLGFLVKEQPAGGHTERKSLYRIPDNLFRFWYRFMPSCIPLLGLGFSERAYDSIIEPAFPTYFGRVFEDVCMQYMRLLMANGTIKELYTSFGHWWGGDPKVKQEVEVDLVMENHQAMLVGECKWQTSPVDVDVLETLKTRSLLFSQDRRVLYALFSRNGFTAEVEAKRGEVLLYDEKDILNVCIGS
jgi:AAA+ ATPase superfamily predicted ATPase